MIYLDEILRDYIGTTPSIRSTHTERLFDIVVRHFDTFLGRRAETSDLTDAQLTAYMRQRRTAGRAEATIDNEAVKLLTLWRHAAKRGLADEPTIRIVRKKTNSPRALLRNEIRALFKAARRSKGIIGGIPVRIYFPALLGIIWNTAERITAVRAVERTDMDCKSGAITFRARKQRGRIVCKKITGSTARDCKRLLAVSQSACPFAIVGHTTIYYHLGRLLITAGIPPERRNKFHALRRSHASYLKLAGGDAPDSLGHDSEATTREFYYDERIVFTRSPADCLFSPYSFLDRLLSLVGW